MPAIAWKTSFCSEAAVGHIGLKDHQTLAQGDRGAENLGKVRGGNGGCQSMVAWQISATV
eukprot:scaffold98563_cov24-Tisochrysis_lutea.AAC.3